MELFKFLGVLFGHTIASENILAVNLSQVTWKQILGDPITLEDIALIDQHLYGTLSKLLAVKEEAQILALGVETFAIKDDEDRLIELIKDGKKTNVTMANAKQYVDLIVKFLAHRVDAQISMIRMGMNEIIPESIWLKFSADDINNKVCGRSKITVDQLKKITRYEGYSETDLVV